MQTKGKFLLMTLEEFDQYLNKNSFNRVIKCIQNHHTYIPGYKNFNGKNHFDMVINMENFHIKDRGFNEIAQNLTSFSDGTIMVGRALEKIPAGIKGANQYGICIEHIGNFDLGGDTMTPEHRQSIIGMNALLCREFNLKVNTDSIVYHHWYDLNSGIRTNGTGTTKTCPGTNFFGGNKVEHAAKNFIPLIQDYLDTTNARKNNAKLKQQYQAEVTTDVLNVRSGPGSDKPVIKSLNRGVVITVFEDKNGWARISDKNQEWVFDKFLKDITA